VMEYLLFSIYSAVESKSPTVKAQTTV